MVNKIASLCKERGISVLELERRSGLAARTIYKWDVNKPSVDKVKTVADTLGVTVDSLLE